MGEKDMKNEKGDLDLAAFLTALLERVMGRCLDYMRMSEMSERAMKQAERTIKDETHTIKRNGIEILKQYGYLNDEDKK